MLRLSSDSTCRTVSAGHPGESRDQRITKVFNSYNSTLLQKTMNWRARCYSALCCAVFLPWWAGGTRLGAG